MSQQLEEEIFFILHSRAQNTGNNYYNFLALFVIQASVGEWGLSRTKICSGAVGVLRVAISGSRQRIGRGRDLR